MRRWLLAVAALGIAGAAPKVPSILDDGDIVPQMILPPPPAEGSVEHRAELAELASIEAARTSLELDAAKSDSKTKDASVFADAIGPDFDLVRLPATATLMAEVRASEKFAADRAKAVFKRPRPWVGNPAIKSCSRDDDEPLSSYPSGHTTMAFSMGATLARLLPAKAPAIMARAARYGQSRIICEVHFRSDVTAGETLGLVVAERLMAKPEFRARYDRAASELRIAGIH